jgi:hypothetical protein
MDAYLSNTKELCGVTEAPVSEFMAQNGDNLLRFALLDKSVINHDMLFPRQSVKISIAMCASLATINDIKLVEGELETLRKALNAGL